MINTTLINATYYNISNVIKAEIVSIPDPDSKNKFIDGVVFHYTNGEIETVKTFYS